MGLMRLHSLNIVNDSCKFPFILAEQASTYKKANCNSSVFEFSELFFKASECFFCKWHENNSQTKMQDIKKIKLYFIILRNNLRIITNT